MSLEESRSSCESPDFDFAILVLIMGGFFSAKGTRSFGYNCLRKQREHAIVSGNTKFVILLFVKALFVVLVR